MPLFEAVQSIYTKAAQLHELTNEHIRKVSLIFVPKETIFQVDPLLLVIGTIGGTLVYLKVSKLYRKSEEPLFKRISGYALSKLRKIPYIKANIDKQLSSARKDIMESIHKVDTDGQFISGRLFIRDS